jgi:hypothetical protein
MFWRLVLHTTVRADVVNAGVPKQALAIGSAPARYLLGDENTEHFWVSEHYSLYTRPPYSVEIQRGYDSFAIEEVFCRCSAPMVFEGWSHVSSNLKAIKENLEFFKREVAIKVLVGGMCTYESFLYQVVDLHIYLLFQWAWFPGLCVICIWRNV